MGLVSGDDEGAKRYFEEVVEEKHGRAQDAADRKSQHKCRSRMLDKTAGFNDSEKLKRKPFMFTRFRKRARHVKKRSRSAGQMRRDKRATQARNRFRK
jgi:hypothetical protein